MNTLLKLMLAGLLAIAAAGCSSLGGGGDSDDGILAATKDVDDFGRDLWQRSRAGMARQGQGEIPRRGIRACGEILPAGRRGAP